MGNGCVLHATRWGGPSKFGKTIRYSFSAIGGTRRIYLSSEPLSWLATAHFPRIRHVSRGTPKRRRETHLGDGNFLLAYSHIGHDCSIGSNTRL